VSGIFRSLAGTVGGLFRILGGILGAIGGLFRSKSQEAQPEAPQQTGAYFLNADDAVSFGNIEYMRSSTSTRRTFPKAKLGEDNAFVQSVSSMKKADMKAQAIAEAKLPSLSEQPKTERRRADSNLDMFRNMARELKKE
jgi:hypothetical protein